MTYLTKDKSTPYTPWKGSWFISLHDKDSVADNILVDLELHFGGISFVQRSEDELASSK